MSELLVLGLSHKTAPVQIRERFAVAKDAVQAVARQAVGLPGLSECFVLSTCNRVEFYVACGDAEQGADQLIDLVARTGGTSPSGLGAHLYEHRGQAAVRHLFRVASSLDSLVVGEPQVLGQLREAYDRCQETAGPLLRRATSRAWSVAKKVRTETEIGRHAVSVSSVAIDLARQIFGKLAGCTALLVGAGKMGELAARHLKGSGIERMLVTNRSFDRARSLAERLGGSARPFEALDELLVAADIVITSTGAAGYLVDVARVRRVLKARKYRPVFFIDIAVPRNVDPALNTLDNVFAYDIDDLSGIANQNLESRRQEAEAAELMVVAETERFQAELRKDAAKPIIVALRAKSAQLKAAELSRAMKRLGDLDPKQLRSVEMLADGLVNKLLHDVLVGVKRAYSEPGGEHIAQAVVDLFGLHLDPEPSESSHSKTKHEG